MTTTTDIGDILEAAHANGADLVAMAQGCHYNYQEQHWVDGHDHAHYFADDGPLHFCGIDITTCQRPIT